MEEPELNRNIAEDPVERAFRRAAKMEPEQLSSHEIAALDEVTDDDDYISHDEVRQTFLNPPARA